MDYQSKGGGSCHRLGSGKQLDQKQPSPPSSSTLLAGGLQELSSTSRAEVGWGGCLDMGWVPGLRRAPT